VNVKRLLGKTAILFYLCDVYIGYGLHRCVIRVYMSG